MPPLFLFVLLGALCGGMGMESWDSLDKAEWTHGSVVMADEKNAEASKADAPVVVSGNGSPSVDSDNLDIVPGGLVYSGTIEPDTDEDFFDGSGGSGVHLSREHLAGRGRGNSGIGGRKEGETSQGRGGFGFGTSRGGSKGPGAPVHGFEHRRREAFAVEQRRPKPQGPSEPQESYNRYEQQAKENYEPQYVPEINPFGPENLPAAPYFRSAPRQPNIPYPFNRQYEGPYGGPLSYEPEKRVHHIRRRDGRRVVFHPSQDDCEKDGYAPVPHIHIHTGAGPQSPAAVHHYHHFADPRLAALLNGPRSFYPPPPTRLPAYPGPLPYPRELPSYQKERRPDEYGLAEDEYSEEFSRFPRSVPPFPEESASTLSRGKYFEARRPRRFVGYEVGPLPPSSPKVVVQRIEPRATAPDGTLNRGYRQRYYSCHIPEGECALVCRWYGRTPRGLNAVEAEAKAFLCRDSAQQEEERLLGYQDHQLPATKVCYRSGRKGDGEELTCRRKGRGSREYECSEYELAGFFPSLHYVYGQGPSVAAYPGETDGRKGESFGGDLAFLQRRNKYY